MRFFTWFDVETELMKNRSRWPESWNRVDVYQDEIVIDIDLREDQWEEDEETFKAIFGKNYDDGEITIDFDGSIMKVVYTEGETQERILPPQMPLFQDIYVRDHMSAEKKNLPGTPIVAFHSFKGGVGRTLSLIALAKEISEQYGDRKKILVIDADLEAPGLTWMLEEGQEHAPVSYLDLLSLIHLNHADKKLAEQIASLIEASNMVIETGRLQVEHYFLPVYRRKDQVFHICSSPEQIIRSQNNKYIITEFLSMVGAALHADLVLVDLRAGITEFSAPFLFDSRVQKFFVSSTSMQSVEGTVQILNEIHEREKDGLCNSKVLLTMIPREMETGTLNRIEDRLALPIEQEIDSETADLRGSYLIRILFDQPFISLGNFYEICEMLKGKELSDTMSELATDLFQKESSEEEGISWEKAKTVLRRLHQIAEREITAEGNDTSSMLSTTSIREIAKDYREGIPQLVVLGAKGSGKTYIYKQMLTKKTWEAFQVSADQRTVRSKNETNIVPLLSSVNLKYLQTPIRECIRFANDALGEERIGMDAVGLNYNLIQEYSEKKLSLTDWAAVWEELISQMPGADFSNLAELDEYLETKKKRLIFLVDGLEDLFMDALIREEENWKYAIRALCQNTINDMRNLKFGNIGMIVFVRKDMAEEAIGVNFEQFKNQYSRYELKWMPTEALRLALWVAAQADPAFGIDIDILKASREALEERLELLWGKKLGKSDSREAVSARWIIAALSDFTGQLQARDIIRFLKCATGNFPESRPPYPDRYLMPAEIRKAIPECSADKYKEIQIEMKTIYSVLKRFEDMKAGDKKLPLTLDQISLTGEEIARLESQGYLITSDKKYYLPEIIRFALGFTYVKGARPKVLSLLAK